MLEAIKSLLTRAASARHSGEAAEAERLYKEAAAEAKANDDVSRAEALMGSAQMRRDAGDRVFAAIHYAEAITLLRAANNTVLLAYALRHAADVRSELYEFAVAASHIDEAIRLYRSFDPVLALDLANALRVAALNHERGARAAWREARDLYRVSADGETAVDAGVEESSLHLGYLAANAEGAA